MTTMFELFCAQRDSNPQPIIAKTQPLPTVDADGFAATELRVYDLIVKHGEPVTSARHDYGCDYAWSGVRFRVRREGRYVRYESYRLPDA